MKKRIFIVICLILTVLMTSCKSNDFTGDGSGELGAYKVKIESYTLAKDSDGKDAVIITYKWMNESKQEKNFITAIADKVYQNGVECPKTLVTNDDYQGANALKDVKRGHSMTLQLAYALQDTKTPLDVELKDAANAGADAPVVKNTFKLA